LTRSKNGKLKNQVVKLYDIYHDADEYAKNIHQANLEHHVLEAGNFYGELTEIISEKVIVSTHKMNRTLLQIGKGLKNYTNFLLPGNMSQDLTWRKQRLTGKRIGLLKSEMVHFSVTPANFFATPISLHNDFFNELIIRNGYDEDLYKLIQQKETIEIHPEDAYQIQQIVISLCNSKKLDYDLMTIELPEFILKSISIITAEPQKQISSSRDIALSKSLEYIHRHINHKIKTTDVCSSVEISERSLRYIFKEMIGISPKKYIKSLKLNKARKDIKKSGGTVDISIIANRWGFGHSGQFAADYKKLFGEFPSESY